MPRSAAIFLYIWSANRASMELFCVLSPPGAQSTHESFFSEEEHRSAIKESLVFKIMSSNEPLNANPTVHHVPQVNRRRASVSSLDDSDDGQYEEIDAQEVFDLIANINDPEHPLTLAQLAVVNLDDISITKATNGLETVHVDLTPTIPHCSMATLIGLCVRVRLNRSLPPRYRVDIKVKEGTHQSEKAVNRQLADKERVAAACENDQLVGVLSGMMESCV